MPLSRSILAEDLAQDEPQPYLWTMNFGPQHPATHTTLRLVLKLEGERVVDAMPDIGYLHSGFEKLGESLDYNQYVTITDRMNYISPMANNVAWHLAVEKLLGIETPPRCQYIRVIIAELSRLTDHLLCLGAMGLDIGAFTHFIYAFNPRETIYDIFEALCGARFTNSYTRVGGLMRDITPEAIRHDPRPAGRDAAGVGRHGAAAGAEPHLRRPHARGGRAQPARRRSTAGPAGRSPGPAASPATSAATSPTWPTPISISRSAARGRATAWPATASAWPKCGRASRSSSRRWRTCPPDR